MKKIIILVLITVNVLHAMGRKSAVGESELNRSGSPIRKLSNQKPHPVHNMREDVVTDAEGNSFKIRHSKIGIAWVTNQETNKVSSGYKLLPRGREAKSIDEFVLDNGKRIIIYNLKEIILNRD